MYWVDRANTCNTGITKEELVCASCSKALQHFELHDMAAAAAAATANLTQHLCALSGAAKRSSKASEELHTLSSR